LLMPTITAHEATTTQPYKSSPIITYSFIATVQRIVTIP
jgi:hypothetical protein